MPTAARQSFARKYRKLSTPAVLSLNELVEAHDPETHVSQIVYLFCSVLEFGAVPTSPTPLLQGAPCI
jgi:hypothetical protein